MQLAPKIRIIAGFLLGPLVPGLMVGLLNYFQHSPYFNIGFFVGMAAMLGYPVAIIIGVPLWFLMKRHGLIKFYHYILAGILLGFVAAFVGNADKLRFLSLFDYAHYYLTPRYLLLGAVMGMVATLSFWLIARPDRMASDGPKDQPPTPEKSP